MTEFEITWLDDRSDDAVLEEIRRVASLLPVNRLTKAVFNSHAKIKSSAVELRFGTWSEATRRAGLSDALPIYTKDAILEDLRRVSLMSEDEPLTISVYSQHGNYSGSHVKRQFGGWREALEMAELGHRYVGPQVTERMKTQVGRASSDDEIIDGIRDVAARLGKAKLSGAEIEANSEITQSQMYRRFGSVSAALKKAGVEQVSHGRRYSENEKFENLLNVWTHYGRPPTVSEMDRPPSTVGSSAYIKRYGRWREALKAFVARANSDGEDGQALDPGEKPSSQPIVSNLSPTVSVNATSRPQSNKRIIADSRAARSIPANVQPEDRRGPNMGLRFRVLQRDRFKCKLCGDHPALNAECVLHVDHVIPWSKGGKTREDNLRTLCATCNIGRGNRFVE